VFITSDRPLTMHDPTPPHKFSGAAWGSSDFVATTMPLSSTACLRVSPADRHPFSERDTRKQVDVINLRTYGWASRYIFGPSAEVLEALHARALADPEAVPAPTKKRVVMMEDLDTADPAVAEANVSKGWDRYLQVREEDGNYRLVSYEVIDSLDDARRSVAPRPGCSGADAARWPSRLENRDPPEVRRR
jgi:hypothetical protein